MQKVSFILAHLCSKRTLHFSRAVARKLTCCFMTDCSYFLRYWLCVVHIFERDYFQSICAFFESFSLKMLDIYETFLQTLQMETVKHDFVLLCVADCSFLPNTFFKLKLLMFPCKKLRTSFFEICMQSNARLA